MGRSSAMLKLEGWVGIKMAVLRVRLRLRLGDVDDEELGVGV